MTMPAGPAYALDTGGSHTLVRVRRGDGQLRSWDEPSCAIAAAGERMAAARLRRTLARVRAELAAEPMLRGWAAAKAGAVRAVLAGGYANSLVADSSLAAALLAQAGRARPS